MTSKGTANGSRFIRPTSSPSPDTGIKGARWDARLKEKTVLPSKMSLEKLKNSRFVIANSQPDSSKTAKDVEILVSCWKDFYEKAPKEEWDQEFSSFTRLIDDIFHLTYSTSRLSIAQSMLDSLYSLIPAEPQYLLYKFTELMNEHWDENVQVLALTRIEASYPFMLSTAERSLFHIMEKVLNLYERDQDHLFRTEAQEFAKVSSSFIFAHRNYLMENGYKELLAYAVAWAAGISARERVTFMEKIADGTDSALKISLFSRVLILVGKLPGRRHVKERLPPAMVFKFPEIKRVLENNIKLMQMEESSGNWRLLSEANRLLWNSGSQFVYPGYPSKHLH